ncbi:MAG: DJ-1/PfpI family protein, partial [Deltaproteobacteria bacterium]|nr:DJ-1/PfpI family protein [Deltaproteobacteria bacterium]
MRTRSRSVALLLFDEVDLLDAVAVVSVLSEAGRRWNFRPFAITPLSARPGRVGSRAQLTLDVPVPLEALEAPELVIVPGGYGARRAADDPRVVAWLERAGAGAETLVGVGAGILLLARAGLLGEGCVATPPELRAELS